MSIDFRSSLRRIKPESRRAQLGLRRPGQLLTASSAGRREAILIDTNVYIQRAAGRLPDVARSLLDTALIFHCIVCLGELATGVGNADPAHPEWAALRDHYSAVFASVPPSRLLRPEPDVWVEAGLVAGTLARTQHFQPHQRKECLNDALIYLTAAKAGLPVLTANRDDFDLIQQVAGRGAFICY